MVSLGQTSEYVYDNWRAELYSPSRIYDKPPQCVDIPDDLKLCHGVGYNKMLLPNLLEHDTMTEVKQQSGSWVPLVHKNCHPGTRVFLCSLFAPLCMERPIYPCRWLCENVRDGCTPIMEAFGFPWPEMFTCEKFPQDDVCISGPNVTEDSKPTGKSKWLNMKSLSLALFIFLSGVISLKHEDICVAQIKNMYIYIYMPRFLSNPNFDMQRKFG